MKIHGQRVWHCDICGERTPDHKPYCVHTDINKVSVKQNVSVKQSGWEKLNSIYGQNSLLNSGYIYAPYIPMTTIAIDSERAPRLDGVWQVETRQEILAQHGLDIEELLTDRLAQEIADEIDRDIIARLEGAFRV